MPLIQPIIRPPSEANSLLLQVTVGCSSNTCTFCGAYASKQFGMMEFSDIAQDIEQAARYYPETRKVFLLDGDALAVSNEKLVPILRLINESFPKLSRIASYANGYNMTKRTHEELKELRDNNLSLIYMGLESGSQKVLDLCKKRATVQEMIKAVRVSDDAGIKSSIIVLLGLGGKKYSEIHTKETAAALNKMQPRYLSFLSLMLIEGTPLCKQAEAGELEELDSEGFLKEAYDIVRGLDLNKTIFRSNHASNYLPLEGRLPKDKQKLLDAFKAGINGNTSLRSEISRGL
ncbi:MAG: radical SAM protein [Candidatus Omnitrophica bacterium]|nr:radical SAM protein [Candidatus Omnitrophota bacterium]